MQKMHVVYNHNLTIPGSKYITHKKPELVRGFALLKGAVGHIVSEKISESDLLLVHSKEYVDSVLGQTKNNGFGNTDVAITEQALWASAAMVEGVKIALEYGNCLVPASGFHHANYDSNWGFCTFNGMVLAAVKSGKKTLIIDGDAHYGDGCVNITKKLGLCDTIHYVQCFDPLADFQYMKEYDLIIYQPGADSLEEGDQLSLSEFHLRDYTIFEQAVYYEKPILWCLGGGYASLGSVLQAHQGSIEMLLRVLRLSPIVGVHSHQQVIDDTSQAVSNHP